ncbi:ring finger domain protein [Moniliophthora roreri]|nr:ring finger domain protein [Moniliophthora roreri]
MTSTPAHATSPKRPVKMASNQSLNHLLNFTLPPRQTHPPPSIPRRSRKTANYHGVWNKERFVNAQYRFVMNPMGDYTVHFADPDIYFQWNDILQVILPRTSALASAVANRDYEGHTTCPICLSPPTAPRMTKCGHIFCFPCILHYLNTSENKWARCPICFDSVNAAQLKAVKWFEGTASPNQDDPVPSSSSASSSSMADTPFDNSPREGATMQMRLIQRPQITTLALPRSHTWPSDLLPPHQAPFHFLPDVYNYAKFMLATPASLVSDLTRDLDDLAVERRLLAGMQDDLGISFIDAAELKVHNQIAKATALDTPALREQIEKAHRDHREIEDQFTYREQRRVEEEAKIDATQDANIPQELLSLKFGTITPTLPSAPSTPKVPYNNKSMPNSANNPRTTPKQRRNVNPPPPSTSTYYYYQAASGLPLYLHPLDIRILLSHFTSYAAFPDSITIRIEAFSEGTVNDDLRKRCKYLAHMPEGADVVFIEADLEGVVGKEGLKNFEWPLKMRRSKRREKGRKDEKARARAEERERERREHETAVEWKFTPSAMDTRFISPPDESVLLPDGTSFPGIDDAPTSATQATSHQQQQKVSGAWGSKSFASALHSTTPTQPRNGGASRPQQREEDEWEMDIAWHELEQRSNGGNGGRKKRSNKLVVLGGGGGRRR